MTLDKDVFAQNLGYRRLFGHSVLDNPPDLCLGRPRFLQLPDHHQDSLHMDHILGDLKVKKKINWHYYYYKEDIWISAEPILNMISL